MRKTLATLVVMALAGAVALGVYQVRGRKHTPDQVVVRALEYLRRGDVGRLRGCYTPGAWETISQPLPDAGDPAAVERLRKHMDSLGEVRVTATSVEGQTARVEAEIWQDGQIEHEIFQLVRVGDRWLID